MIGRSNSLFISLSVSSRYKEIRPTFTEYLGSTVQVIPHVTNEIKEFVYRVGEKTDAGMKEK